MDTLHWLMNALAQEMLDAIHAKSYYCQFLAVAMMTVMGRLLLGCVLQLSVMPRQYRGWATLGHLSVRC